ncbi:MAG TPA: cyclic pyranopterin monophosphate synthase MoaC [bacterium]|nr:cyclic pyranopterin monophosphate synthase MoaC [bacterium]
MATKKMKRSRMKNLGAPRPRPVALSHVDSHGKARMVDVGDKEVVRRTATAQGFIRLSKGTVELIRENGLKKGDVLSVAQVAGIMAAKLTPQIVPLCHPLELTQILVAPRLMNEGVEVTATVRCVARTGVEMEALTAVTGALLAVYDMCKKVDHRMVLEKIELVEKIKEAL